MTARTLDGRQVDAQPPGYLVEARAPADAPTLLRQQFMELVLKGGEIRKDTLPGLVDNALVIGFAWVEHTLAAVGGVKRPNLDYRSGIFEKAGLADPGHYPYELGWVFVEERFRGVGMARALTVKLVQGLADWPVYATSRVNNPGMHRALVDAGFKLAGTPYPGRRKGEQIQLFLKGAR